MTRNSFARRFTRSMTSDLNILPFISGCVRGDGAYRLLKQVLTAFILCMLISPGAVWGSEEQSSNGSGESESVGRKVERSGAAHNPSGVIIDARGLSLSRSRSPKIYIESDGEIVVVYGEWSNLSDDEIIRIANEGSVAYVECLDEAYNHERAGDNPIVIKADSVCEHQNWNIKLSNVAGVQFILAREKNPEIVSEQRVIIVQDEFYTQPQTSCSGVIIDASDLAVKVSESPKILDPNGAVIYGFWRDLSEDERIRMAQEGIVIYRGTLDKAKEHERAGDNPLVLEADSLSKPSKIDIVLSESEVDKIEMIKNISEVFDSNNVIIVTGNPDHDKDNGVNEERKLPVRVIMDSLFGSLSSDDED